MRSTNEQRIRTFKTGGLAIGAGLIVVADTTDANNETVKLPAGADPVSGIVGITKNAATTSDTTIDVVIAGTAELFVKGSGTNIAFGDFIGVHGTTGSGKKVVAGTLSQAVGTAQEKATADDVIISVAIGLCLIPVS